MLWSLQNTIVGEGGVRFLFQYSHLNLTRVFCLNYSLSFAAIFRTSQIQQREAFIFLFLSQFNILKLQWQIAFLKYETAQCMDIGPRTRQPACSGFADTSAFRQWLHPWRIGCLYTRKSFLWLWVSHPLFTNYNANCVHGAKCVWGVGQSGPGFRFPILVLQVQNKVLFCMWNQPRPQIPHPAPSPDPGSITRFHQCLQ